MTDPEEIGPALDRAFASGVPYLVNVADRPGRRVPAVVQPGLSPALVQPGLSPASAGLAAGPGRHGSGSSWACQLVERLAALDPRRQEPAQQLLRRARPARPAAPVATRGPAARSQATAAPSPSTRSIASISCALISAIRRSVRTGVRLRQQDRLAKRHAGPANGPRVRCSHPTRDVGPWLAASSTLLLSTQVTRRSEKRSGRTIHPLSRALYDVRPDRCTDVHQGRRLGRLRRRGPLGLRRAPPRRPPAVRLAGRAADSLPACRATPEDFPTPTEG